MTITFLGGVLLSAAYFTVAFALVAVAAAMITTPGLTPAAIVRYCLARQTARTAMARFDREWARQAAGQPRDRS